MNTCQIGITRAVEKFTKDKPWYRFNGKDFIQVVTSPNKRITPKSFYRVAVSLSNSLNKAINTDLILGKVFYPEATGVRISPTLKQLNLLNSQEGKDRQEAYALLNAETPEKDRMDIENDTSFGLDEENESYIEPQLEELPSSRASDDTLKKVKEAAGKMGIDIQGLSDYVKSNPNIETKGINALADAVKGVIAVAQGMENVALTEEMVHIATSMLEQTNPQLITALISKIDRFAIYKKTLETYKNIYKLSDGRPDIRKIKKEAVDKLIAEVIINQNEGSTEFPELMKEENRSLIRQWWDTILDYIRGIYQKSNISLFEETAEKIMSGEAKGEVKEGDVFFQVKNEAVDNIYNAVIDRDSRLQLNPETPTDKRHYTFDGKRVLKSITEKIKEKNRMPDRTPSQKISDDQKKEWGTKGHELLQNYIVNCLIDKDGYKRETPLDVPTTAGMDPKIEKNIKAFASELISSYAPGTRFIVERKVVNEKVKGMIASTVDFMAIEPSEKTGVKVDVLDWKFSSIDKTKTEDIPWYKTSEWKEQMGEYTKILYNYGLRPEQLRKARMIPFIVNYDNKVKGDQKSPLIVKSLEIGSLDNLKETSLYLLPVPLDTESTGSSKVDSLLKALRQQYEEIYKKASSEENKDNKILRLNELSKAIRKLHLQLNFEPLVNVGKTFLNNASSAISSFENIDFSSLSREEIEKRIGDLLEYLESARMFASLDDVYLSKYPKEGHSAEETKTLFSLEKISKSTERMTERINDILTSYTLFLADRQGIHMDTYEDETGNVKIAAEAPITGFEKTFKEASKLPSRIINLAANLWMNARNTTNIKIARKIDDFHKLLDPLEKEAKAQGKKTFDLIGKTTSKGLHLIRKIDSSFWEEEQKAKDERNKQWFINNINKESYETLLKTTLERKEKELDMIHFSSDEEKDRELRQYRKKILRDSLDMSRETFNGYNNGVFKYLFRQSFREEGHLSKEYTQMSEAARNMWQFFTEMNKKARAMGYLSSQPLSFFPLIEATTLEKFYQSGNFGLQLKDFFKDLYTVKVEEEHDYSKVDEKTGEVKKSIPKHFTRTDKQLDQLSRDVSKVGALWIKAVYEYETAANMENTLQALLSVEKTKGSLMMDGNKNIIFENGAPKINEQNRNADIMETIIDDYLYQLQEDSSSIGNVNLTGVVSKFKKGEEGEHTVLSVKKGIKSMDTLVRAMAVGLKPLISFANWAGTQFQQYINAGGFYKFSEFEKNHLKVLTGAGFSTVEKGLLNMIVPLNEDVTTEKRRKMSSSLTDYLSTWTFMDVMMSLNSFPEKRLQFANAMSFIDNSMAVDGKIVNIRQYLKQQDRQNYKLDYQQRRSLEKSFEKRVEELKQSSSLSKTAKIENDVIVLPGVSDEEIGRFRMKVIEYNRMSNGMLSQENKAGYRRDSILNSFMMFKTWIPKLLYTRTLDLHKNAELEEWEYGRARAFVKTWVHLGLRNTGKIMDIIKGTEEGLRILDEILQEKKEEYYRKTGQTLEITPEEFYDVMRKQIADQFKELGLLFSLMGTVIAAKAAEPPEDASDYEKNRYKFWAKLINKTTDEISFYYDPRSANSITKGSIMPALGLVVRVEQIINSIGKESIGFVTNNQEMMDKAHPLKYFLNVIPVGGQFQNEILPYISPELAREMGIRVTTQSRQQ